ncbi:pilus assembly protein N-terminal domain-containing protein [bacterium]|nr:pilus assembly protein N-terminal domain-containing protein [bacterium]
MAIFSDSTFCKKGFAVILLILLFANYAQSLTEDVEVLDIYSGQSEVLDFEKPVSRIAISNPDVASASVITPLQILIDGKKTGITTLVVWPEKGTYMKYKLRVVAGVSKEQVMLNVKFIEVNKSALKTLGFDFLVKKFNVREEVMDMGSYAGKVNDPSDPLILGNSVDFFFNSTTQNISGIIKALWEDNLLTVLAAPNLSAISGAEARFLAGGEFPIPLVSGTGGSQSISIVFKEYGVRLKFVPTVLSSKLINIKVEAEVSNLDFENGIILSGFRIPSLDTRKAETVVELEEGQYFILGGLLSSDMAKTVSKIPGLGHIPILGKLFSSERYLNNESELLITLSPKIVRGIGENEIPAMKLQADDK